MKRYILLFLLVLGLSAFVPGQAKADEDFSMGPVTVYRHHSPEWYRDANVCAVASGGNINGENTSGENITGAIILIKTSKVENTKVLSGDLPENQADRPLVSGHI